MSLKENVQDFLWKDKPPVERSYIVGGYESQYTPLEIGLGSDAEFDAISRLLREEERMGTNNGHLAWYKAMSREQQIAQSVEQERTRAVFGRTELISSSLNQLQHFVFLSSILLYRALDTIKPRQTDNHWLVLLGLCMCLWLVLF